MSSGERKKVSVRLGSYSIIRKGGAREKSEQFRCPRLHFLDGLAPLSRSGTKTKGDCIKRKKKEIQVVPLEAQSIISNKGQLTLILNNKGGGGVTNVARFPNGLKQRKEEGAENR